VQDKAVQYPPRTLIFEQGALSNVPVGEMWDKVAASRATYSLDMWNQLGVWQSFGGALTFPTDNTVNMTLTPTQWLSLKANAFNTTQLINKIKALQ